MNPNDKSSDYWLNITKIVNFFRNTHGSGFLFCACDNQRLIREINSQIIRNAASQGLDVGRVYISYEDMDDILSVLRKGAKETPGGIILDNLNELIERSDGGFVRDINMGREILIEMGVPMVFWLSEENISRFANQATDLFNRRDRSVVYFSDLSYMPESMERLDEFYELGFKSTENYDNLKLKIGLMEKQLHEAKKKNISEERIAKEIAADLIELYLEASLYPEAFRLFDDYHSYYENAANIKFINLCGNICNYKSDWDKALNYFFKSERILIEFGDEIEVQNIYNNIGLVCYNKGEFDKAMVYFHKSERLCIKIGNQASLANIFNNIGRVYRRRGVLEKALTYFLKTEKIRIEIGDRAGLAMAYNGIGLIYRDKGELDNALTYFYKSKQICTEVGDRYGLGYNYGAIGVIYHKQKQWEKASEYYQKAERIRIEVGDKRGLAFLYFYFGKYYSEIASENKATSCFIIAGYISKILGINYKLSEWSWALNPLIEEMGEERFMEEGKRLLEERMNSAGKGVANEEIVEKHG